MALGERLSDLMKAFHAEVVKLETPAKQAILSALMAAVVPLKDGFRKLVDGTVIPHFDVTLGHLKQAVPDYLRGDAAELARALDKEIQARGPNWAKEGAHLAVKTFLLDPLQAHMNPPAVPATAGQVESAVAKAVAAAVPAAVAAHLAANPPTPVAA